MSRAKQMSRSHWSRTRILRSSRGNMSRYAPRHNNHATNPENRTPTTVATARWQRADRGELPERRMTERTALSGVARGRRPRCCGRPGSLGAPHFLRVSCGYALPTASGIAAQSPHAQMPSVAGHGHVRRRQRSALSPSARATIRSAPTARRPRSKSACARRAARQPPVNHRRRRAIAFDRRNRAPSSAVVRRFPLGAEFGSLYSPSTGSNSGSSRASGSIVQTAK